MLWYDAGRPVGAKPFERTGTEEEVRAAINAVGEQRDLDDIVALTAGALITSP